MHPKNLRDLTISGIQWTVVIQLFKQVINFSLTILLTRLLDPEDFGLVGMTIIFTGFIYLIGELGFGASVIQHKNIDDLQLSSLFWLNIFFGIVLAIGFFTISPTIAQFFGEERLEPVLRLISVNIFLQPIGVVQTAYLLRQMDYRTLGIVEITSILVSGLIAIVLALLGYGPYCLVMQYIVLSLFTATLVWLFCPWKPKLYFNFKSTKELVNYSGNLLGFNVINYWLRNGDNLLIGKFFGAIELGLYSRSYSIMLLPLTQITSVITRVMFPSLSRVQDNIPRFKNIYIRTVSIIALITFPMMVGLAILADEFVLVIFGSKWIGLAPLITIFSFVGLAHSILSTVGWIYQALGRTNLLFKWGLYSGLVILFSFAVGIIIGSNIAVAVSYTIANYLFLVYPGFNIPLKLIDYSFIQLVLKLKNIIMSTLIMGVLVLISKAFLYSKPTPTLAILIMSSGFGSIVYVVCLMLFREQAVMDILNLLISRWIKLEPILKALRNKSA